MPTCRVLPARGATHPPAAPAPPAPPRPAALLSPCWCWRPPWPFCCARRRRAALMRAGCSRMSRRAPCLRRRLGRRQSETAEGSWPSAPSGLACPDSPAGSLCCRWQPLRASPRLCSRRRPHAPLQLDAVAGGGGGGGRAAAAGRGTSGRPPAPHLCLQQGKCRRRGDAQPAPQGAAVMSPPPTRPCRCCRPHSL